MKKQNFETREGWTLPFPPYMGGELGKLTYIWNLGYDTMTDFNPSDYSVVCASETNLEELEAYVAQLQNAGYTVKQVNDGAFIKSWRVFNADSEMYMYLSVNAGEVRFILDRNESVGSERFSYCYLKQEGERTALYLYGLHMDPVGINVGEKFPDGTVNTKTCNCGQLLILKLADNSVVIIDGGDVTQMSKTAAEGLDRFLHRITDTPEGKTVRISAWIITHSHRDHFGGFARFLIHYHAGYELDRMCFSFNYRDSRLPRLIDEHLKVYYPNIKYYRPHTGESFTLADARFDVLYTYEDILDAKTGDQIPEQYPWGKVGVEQNNSSLVLRITFDRIQFMLLGDIYFTAERILLQNYGAEYLRADVMQVAHHGLNDVWQIYQAISPAVTLYPQSSGGAAKAIWGNANNVLQHVIQYTRGGIDNIYFAGDCTACVEMTDGKLAVSTEAVVGADYDGKWDLFDPFEEI